MKLLGLHLDRYIDYAQLRGIPRDRLLAGINYSPASNDEPARMIDQADFYAAIDRIGAQLDDDLLGIRAGSHLNLNTLGAVYQISQKTVTVQEALYYCQAYLMDTLPLVRVTRHVNDNDAIFTYQIDNWHVAANRIVLETILTVVSREMKVLCGENAAIRLYSPYCSSAYPAGWQKGSEFSVEIDQMLLKATQKTNSHWGLDILIPQYLGLIEEVKADGAFASKVRQEMLFMAKPDLPSIGSVADSFNLTTRTLQRRLKEEGTSFRQIVESLTWDICHLLIRHERYAISDIANLLGYADSASFIHRFNKRHGSSPLKFRAQLALGDAATTTQG